MSKKPIKVRINITIKPDLLKRVDAASGSYGRSDYIGAACEEKLAKKKSK